MSSAPETQIAALLAQYREQKAAIAALEASLSRTKAALDQALGADTQCVIAGLGEIRRIPPSQTTAWDTGKLSVIIASLRLVGDDKLADQIEETRLSRPRAGYLAITLTTPPA